MPQTRIITPNFDWDRSIDYQRPNFGCGRPIGRQVVLHDPLKETHTPYKPAVVFAAEPDRLENCVACSFQRWRGGYHACI